MPQHMLSSMTKSMPGTIFSSSVLYTVQPMRSMWQALW